MPQPVYRVGDTGPAVAEIRARLSAAGMLREPLVADPANGTVSDSLDEMFDDTDGPALDTTFDSVGSSTGSAFDATSDDMFDDSLARAVREFQQSRGLTTDGLVGPQTWRHLDDARWALGDRVLSYTVSHPTTGDDVLALQQRLFELGFDPGRVDGVIGGETERALREFQRSVGISADGTCGPITLQALARLSRTVTGGAPHALREAERMRRSGPGAAGKVIVIDPGHGGSEQGSVGLGLTEAVLVEDLAARVEGRLAAVGATAYLSRGRLAIDDEPADESTRADFANGAGADLLVSLHVDCDDNPRASGVAAYFYGAGSHGAHSVVGEMFADLVMRELVARTDLLDGRIHGKTWDLLRRTRMPAVRLEIGYLSNAHDAARLADPSFRDVIAEAIVVAMQRLWLPEGSDAATGTLHLPDFAGHRS